MLCHSLSLSVKVLFKKDESFESGKLDFNLHIIMITSPAAASARTTDVEGA